ncbi:hypothetical protein Glove_360g105 [Diversispora epigaea]|uniref:Uncharacterized protein n=1 Tax=Diversispora epigaea TaxID=1348612 RepID=A0A397HA32_9GLOM|nr:hypothetical protein Glove_360g105 [Diversispora epigaea]
MSLDDEDFSRINEFQIIREENSQVFYQYESDQDYAGDISFGEISHSSNIPEEYENFDEILPASLQSNEEPEVKNIKEFPNEAYTDLMALVIENNLNNKAGNAIIKFFNKYSDLSQLSPLPKNIETGRKFMDKMNISQLSYSKYCVLTYNSQDYFVHYCPIKNCIKNLLSNPDILKNLMFRYENSKIEDEKSYGEQNSRNWWKQAERSISNHVNILSIILYSDATTTDTLGKSSLHSIYVSLGNIPTWRRNKEDAKQLLGYLPILSAKNKKEKKSSEFKELARETFHNSIKFLLDPLFQVQREDLIDIRKEVILRNHVNMKEYFDSNTSNLAGLEQVNNYFWSIPNLNIYAATVPDRMHHLDLGLFKYQIEFTMELLKKKKSLNKVNERIADIPRHSQLKVFKKGIQLSRLTASEYRDMMKIMVFVVDDLQIEDLSEVYVKWNEMYLLSKSVKFKESDLENFQKAINDWGDLFIKLFQKISNSYLKFLKLHSWIYHIVDTIREYGAINGYTTETYESLHKTYVKIPYRLSNKKEVEKQIMENIRRRAIVSRNRVGKTKTPMAFVYTAKLFDFDLSESMIEQNKIDPNLDKKMIKATVPDRMHHLDLGLFKYQIEFTMELLKKKKSLNKVNERIADIPRHSQLKVFKKGIQLSRLTASEYRDMMKIMVFVVDDLQIEDLSEVYVKWNEMYLLSKSVKFKESDLENFQKAINDWGDLFIKLFQKISNSYLKFLKLHSWIYHIVDTIREYGAINGYTTETYESLHKTYVKIPYRLSNKKEVEKQIMENIRRRAIVSRNRVGKTKTPMAFVYTAKLFDFDLSESMIEQNKIDPNLDKKMIKGFEKFIDCLKTLLITEIRLPNKSPMHLALVQWYNFIEEIPFVYGRPLLRLVEVYNFIEIEAIEDTIHVVPRFDKNNEYFVI